MLDPVADTLLLTLDEAVILPLDDTVELAELVADVDAVVVTVLDAVLVPVDDTVDVAELLAVVDPLVDTVLVPLADAVLVPVEDAVLVPVDEPVELAERETDVDCVVLADDEAVTLAVLEPLDDNEVDCVDVADSLAVELAVAETVLEALWLALVVAVVVCVVSQKPQNPGHAVLIDSCLQLGKASVLQNCGSSTPLH